jgi:hypothetical protein
MCGAYGAARWAKVRRLNIHYIDNCWLYVTVDRNDLVDFMLEILEGQVSPDPGIRPGVKYLLMAEEY